jgi:hypothetical protein
VKFILSVIVHFISTGQITPPLTVTVGQVLTERNVSLLITDNVDNGYDVLLPAEEKGVLLMKVFFF